MTKRTRELLLVALLTAGVLSLFASTHPDGLERVLEDLGIGAGAPALLGAPLPDYQVPAVSAPVLSGSLAGLIGLALTLGVAWAAFRLLAGPGRRHGTSR